MSTYVILGATGTVGRELTAALASRPGSTVYAVSRNRVLLDELAARIGCTTLSYAVSGDADPRQLPAADVLVDLTFTGGRHPRAIVRSAEGSISFLRRYLEVNPRARLVHTGTWVVTPRSGEPRRPRTKLLWDDTYVLTKSAAERALARAWIPERMLVVRLGNVLTPDSGWGIGLLRALRAGRVRHPSDLKSPAGLSTVSELAELVEGGSAREVEQTDAGAGWTWGEVLQAACRELDLGDEWGTEHPVEPEAVPAPSRFPTRGAILHRALWATPLYLGHVSLDRPAIQRLVRPLNALRGGNAVREIMRLPPGLPPWSPIPGWRREEAALGDFTKILAGTFVTRGYANS
jgi:hypothetical protein